VGKFKGKNHLEDLDEDWSIILKCIFKMFFEGAWTGLMWIRTGTGGLLL
jgi:hypothetical protein